jgi:large subunit ribosomal protein L21
MKYVIFETGGKQYKAAEGEKVRVEKIPDGVIGQEIEFTNVLMVGGENIQIGTPTLTGVKVAGQIIAQDKAAKILVFKKKRRKGFAKKQGHRQPYTEILIKEIS